MDISWVHSANASIIIRVYRRHAPMLSSAVDLYYTELLRTMAHPYRIGILIAAGILLAAGCSVESRVSSGPVEPTSSSANSTSPRAPVAVESDKPFPITWRIGDVDPRFGVSTDELRTCIERAIRVWETAANRDLFAPADSLGMPVALIFDGRQEMVLKRKDSQLALDGLRENLERAERSAKAQLKLYNSAVQRVNEMVEAHDRRVKEHNQAMDEWNARGDATESDAIAMRTKAEELNQTTDLLARERSDVAALDRELDALRAVAERARDEYNAAVASYNQSFAGKMDRAGEFVKSVMGKDNIVSRKINIYEVESLESLTVVLAHEFGHALGLDHVSGSGSLMSESYVGKPGVPPPLKLSERDLEALRACLAKLDR